jgi:hypothetical protein
MRSILGRRPSFATVISLIALFAALGGTSYAAASLITGKNVKNSSLTGSDIKNGSLKGPDIKDGSLSAKEFAAGTLLKGDKGDTGATGAKGDKGDTGPSNTIAYSFRLGNGETKVFASTSALRLSAGCAINDGGNDTGTILLETLADNSAMDSNNGDEYSDFDQNNNPAHVNSNGDTTGLTEWEQYNDGNIAVGADGSSLQMNNYGIGVNLGGHTGTCTFAGSVVVTPAS